MSAASKFLCYFEIKSYFSGLTDPRVERTREHRPDAILLIAIASVFCGADGWNDMEAFGHAKEDWLRNFLQLPKGRPFQ
jgi:hypothetical protein